MPTTERRREQLREAQRRYREAHPERVAEQKREYGRRYREANLERLREYDRQRDPNRWRQYAKPQSPEYYQAYYAANAEHKKAAAAARRAELRSVVFGHYGESCACCDSAEQLDIDHIGGGGKAHRLELFGKSQGGQQFYRWLVEQGFPDGYQPLCRPCNASKGEGERCRIDHDDAAAAAERRRKTDYQLRWLNKRRMALERA